MAVGVMVAVKVTDTPSADGFGAEMTVTEDAALFTKLKLTLVAPAVLATTL